MSRERELEEALKPFARYALSIKKNPFLKFLRDEIPIAGNPMAPTIGDCKRALELVPDVDLVSNRPELPDFEIGESFE